MHNQKSSKSIPVAKGGIVTLVEGSRIRCDAGTVWITQDNDIRDVVLNAGERFDSDRPGTVVVYGLQPAVLSASSPAGRASSLPGLLTRVLRTLLPQRRLAMS